MGGAQCTNDPEPGLDAGTVDNAECNRDSDCLSGHCPDLGSGEARACRSQCRTDGTCDQGTACQQVGGYRLCLPLQDNRAVGNRCGSSRQCVSGTCALDEGADGGVCVEQCPASGACPAGQLCAVDGRISSRAFCLPPTESLANGDDCSNGRQCVGGRCLPWGNRTQCGRACDSTCVADAGLACVVDEFAGEGCLPLVETSGVCGSNRECSSVTCYDAPYDAGVGAGVCVGECGDDSQCPAGMACLPLTGTTERRCVPLQDARAAGETCVRADECASGRCAQFVAPEFDAGTLCADPCETGGACTAPRVCWGFNADAGSRGLCGPRPF